MQKVSYLDIGGCLAPLIALPVFIGTWWHCVDTYGFLIGFGIGWLPSAILAILAGMFARFLWPICLLVAAILAHRVFG